jgi:hypothetical protein
VYLLVSFSKDLSYPGHEFSASLEQQSDAPKPSGIESPTVMTNNGGGIVDTSRMGNPRLNPPDAVVSVSLALRSSRLYSGVTKRSETTITEPSVILTIYT